MRRLVLLALAACTAKSSPHHVATHEEPLRPPVAAKKPKATTIHGDTRVDDYGWLREKENPEVIEYLNAENRYTDAVMKPTAKLQETLYKEIVGRVKETDLSVPYKEGDYYYYTRTEEGKQYKVYGRKKGTLDAPEEVLLDLNVLAEGEKFMALGAYKVSPDGRTLAFSTDRTGHREYTLQVKDLQTGTLGPEAIPHTRTVAWASDNRTLFYVTEDDAKRDYRVWRHTLGNTDDKLVFEEKDELYSVEVERSRSGGYVFLTTSSSTTSEVWAVRADHPGEEPRVIEPREKGHEYYVDHGGDRFYILTNDKGHNFRLVSAPTKSPGKKKWKELVPHSEQAYLDAVAVFAKHYVLAQRSGGLPQLRVVEIATGKSHEVTFPDASYALDFEENHEYATTKLRYLYTSFVTPMSIYEYDMASHESTLLKRTEVPGGYDASRYETARIFAAAPDGAQVPVSLVYRKGLRLDGKNPLYLRGYGAYGIPQMASFAEGIPSLLDRGVVVAIAHIRGGGEMGKAWHEQGRMRSKRNTFTDFIAVAEHLIAEKYTSSDRLVIAGRSAGGLLMGAVLNMRPDLFKAAIAGMPFVDLLNTMLDASIPLTVGEYEEWGNPNVKEDYDYMRTYCPYTNVEAKPYPAMLVETSLNDSQVGYWEPAKWVAKLRAHKTDDNVLLLKINMEGGHGGSSGRYDKYREVAFDYAFLLTQVGATERLEK